MSLLKLAVMYISAYCEKHRGCDGCRLHGTGGCAVQMVDLPPQDWDTENMVKEKGK